MFLLYLHTPYIISSISIIFELSWFWILKVYSKCLSSADPGNCCYKISTTVHVISLHFNLIMNYSVTRIIPQLGLSDSLYFPDFVPLLCFIYYILHCIPFPLLFLCSLLTNTGEHSAVHRPNGSFPHTLPLLLRSAP